MCLIFIALNDHPNYKLIVAANRDEFYQRRTAGAAFWNDHPDVLGGRDLEAMGTWMAVNRQGKISMVTNYRDLSNINPQAPSRGQLVSEFLINGETPARYLKALEPHGKEYNGFNLLVGNQDELFYYSNYQKGVMKVDAGFYGLSNHLLETPWPKVVRGKQKVKPLLEKDKVDPEQLLDVLYDIEQAPTDELPDTGIGLEREKALSSMFIKTPNYGTRCSTVVTVNQQNQLTFTERVYDVNDFSFKTNRFEFQISSHIMC